MRVLLILLLFSVCASCSDNNAANPAMNSEREVYLNNEGKFSFLVFDARRVDSFFLRHNRLEPQCEALTNAFLQLARTPGTTVDVARKKKFAKHTKSPNSSDSALALELLTVAKRDSYQYFFPDLLHLFSYGCLPEEFQYTWVQDVSGDFKFNGTFFERLRAHCKTLHEHIFSSRGFWDERLRKVFGEFVRNGITAQQAMEIKTCINQIGAFSDGRLQTDKEHFLEFLENIIAGKWRLLLYDKN